MNRLLASLLCVLTTFLSFSSVAQTGKYRAQGMPAGMAVANLPAVADWFIETYAPSGDPGYAPAITMENSTIAVARIVGTQFEYRLENQVTSVVTLLPVYIVAACTVNAAASLSNYTTVFSIDSFGNMTAASTPTNPQCRDGCVVAAPVGLPAGYQCQAYRDPTVAFAVGVNVWVSCLGSLATPIIKTGETCNSVGTDYGVMTASPAQPLGYTLVNAEPPAPPSTGGMSINKAVDVTSVCIDANANGIDDVTGITCAVQSATALKTLRDGKQSEMTNIGKTGDIGAEVGVLSNQNGSWFNIPQKLLDVLNPPLACSLEYVMPNLAMMPTSTVSFNGWCAVYTVVEPYFAFLMWLTTVLVLMSLWRKV